MLLHASAVGPLQFYPPDPPFAAYLSAILACSRGMAVLALDECDTLAVVLPCKGGDESDVVILVGGLEVAVLVCVPLDQGVGYRGLWSSILSNQIEITLKEAGGPPFAQSNV